MRFYFWPAGGSKCNTIIHLFPFTCNFFHITLKRVTEGKVIVLLSKFKGRFTFLSNLVTKYYIKCLVLRRFRLIVRFKSFGLNWLDLPQCIVGVQWCARNFFFLGSFHGYFWTRSAWSRAHWRRIRRSFQTFFTEILHQNPDWFLIKSLLMNCYSVKSLRCVKAGNIT